jgi:cell division protein FtsB
LRRSRRRGQAASPGRGNVDLRHSKKAGPSGSGAQRSGSGGPRTRATARPAGPGKPSVKSAPAPQMTGGAVRTRTRDASPKRGTGNRKAAGVPPTGGQKGRHVGNRPRTLRSKLSGISPRTVILLMLMVIFIVLAISPVTRNLEATGRLRKMNDEFKKEKAVTDSLEKEVSEARSLEYVEKEARRQRMVAPGEILYLVTAGNSGSEVKYRVKALQSMEEAWERVRQLLHSVPRQK